MKQGTLLTTGSEDQEGPKLEPVAGGTRKTLDTNPDIVVTDAAPADTGVSEPPSPSTTAGTSVATPRNIPPPGFSPEAIAFLGISQFEGVGFKTIRRIGGRDGIRHFLDAKDVGTFDRAIADSGGKFSVAAVGGDWAALRRNLWHKGITLARSLADQGASLVFEGDPGFPAAFNAILPANRPQWLFYQGDLSVLDRSCLTIVGTREPTEMGEYLAKYAVGIARQLGAPVVSGLARGIDNFVHEWCLKVRLPTVSVMGTGILKTYPAKHTELGREIVKAGGLLVTEYLPDQGPSAENFVRRNRLQAALGQALIPAEWARKSGTAHTVRYARELGRTVIELAVDGIDKASDAGDGDLRFSLPHEHFALLEALTIAVSLKEESGHTDHMQYGFSFGDVA